MAGPAGPNKKNASTSTVKMNKGTQKWTVSRGNGTGYGRGTSKARSRTKMTPVRTGTARKAGTFR